MNHKKIGVIFLVLLLLAMIPFPFTKGPQSICSDGAAYTCLLVDTDGRKSDFCIMGKPCVCEKQQERQGG